MNGRSKYHAEWYQRNKSVEQPKNRVRMRRYRENDILRKKEREAERLIIDAAFKAWSKLPRIPRDLEELAA